MATERTEQTRDTAKPGKGLYLAKPGRSGLSLAPHPPAGGLSRAGLAQTRSKNDSALQHETDLTVPDSGQTLATAIIAASGVGKTLLEGILAAQGVLRGMGQVLIDPTGSLSTNLLHQLWRFLSFVEFPVAEHDYLWARVRYIPIGHTDLVTPFPIYFKRDRESLLEISERLLTAITLSHPQLVTQAPVSYPRMRQVGVNAGVVLASLGFQPTECEDLLLNTLDWERSGRFDEALRRYPQDAASAVSYFRKQYLPLSRSGKLQESASFLDQVFRLSTDPSLRALFGAREPGIDWEEVLEEKPQTVIVDTSPITDPESRKFATLWILLGLLEHLKHRGRRGHPVALLIDEFASLTHKAHEGANPLSELLDEFLAQYARRNQVFFTCCFQSLQQLPQELQQTVLRFGNLVVGRAGTLSEAKVLADEVLFKKDPLRVKHVHHAWGRTPYVPGYGGGEYFPLEEIPMYFPLPEQLELAAQRILELPRLSFFVRPATEEGSVSESISKLTIRTVIEDPETKELVFPDDALIDRLKAHLAKRSGIPVATILKEQEARLKTPGVAAAQRTATKLPPGKTTPPPPRSEPPQLDEEEQAFLRFIIDHQPDTPVARVYKGLGLSVRRGTQLRGRLREHGFLTFLPGRSKAGRQTSVLLPTLKAYALLGAEPPTGRGGSIHRHIQQLVVQGAEAKGYKTQVEQDLGNGGICDVCLEKGDYRIAVEIAVYSTVERELAHIRHALSAGYDTVYGVFVDEHLLGRVQAALTQGFSLAEARKVRLVPVSRLSHLGE
jgi:hypothetical protein